MTGSELRTEALLRDLRAVAVPWITVRVLLAVAFITALARDNSLSVGPTSARARTSAAETSASSFARSAAAPA